MHVCDCRRKDIQNNLSINSSPPGTVTILPGKVLCMCGNLMHVGWGVHYGVNPAEPELLHGRDQSGFDSNFGVQSAKPVSHRTEFGSSIDKPQVKECIEALCSHKTCNGTVDVWQLRKCKWILCLTIAIDVQHLQYKHQNYICIPGCQLHVSGNIAAFFPLT